MALTVVVRSGEGKSAPRITFDAPRVVIGRGEGCEVRLPDPSVSHRHASIRQRGTEYIVLDEGSTNGTFIGPVRLSPHAPRVLKSGDLIRIGRVWLEATIEQAPPTRDVQMATREMALALVADALAADGDKAAPSLRVVDGPGQPAELLLAEFDHAYVVGRMQSADLNVDDPDLSRRHVEVFRRGDRIYAKDLGSKNGSRLGELPLPANAEIPWPRGESLFIGKSRLVFEDPVGRALEELERAADERLQEGALIDPPVGVAPPPELRTVAPESTRREAPVAARPKRAPLREPPEGWTLTDVAVVGLALVVLAFSVLGLVWITRQ